jgi:hypothetical protein
MPKILAHSFLSQHHIWEDMMLLQVNAFQRKGLLKRGHMI